MTEPTPYVVVEASGGVVQDVTTYPEMPVITIDYDEVELGRDEFTNETDVAIQAFEYYEALRQHLPPGPLRKRIREGIMAARRGY